LVLKNKIKPILIITVIIFLIQSCEEFYFVDCDSCNKSEPRECTLEVLLGDFGLANPYTVSIYKGTVENGILIHHFETYNSIVELKVKLNAEYSAVATITIGDKLYKSYDSARPKVKIDNTSCEYNCYIVLDKTLNLKIKG